MRTITLRDVFAAMRKNGYPKAIGSYRRDNVKGEVREACAVGQAGLNLGVEPIYLAHAINDSRLPFNIEMNLLVGGHLGSIVFRMNDYSSLSVPEIADTLEKKYEKYLDTKIEVPS